MEAVDHSERERRVKEFDETRAGVKGIVDSGVTKIPAMFIHPPENLQQNTTDHGLRVPVIDLEGLDQSSERRKEIVDEISRAAEAWGFFQIVNHGIPMSVMEKVLKGVRGFHEQPQEEWYSNDFTRTVNFYSNGNLNAVTPADWRDSLSCKFLKDQSESEAALPQVCRVQIIEYRKYIIEVKEKLAELLSEALGLSRDHLASIGCVETSTMHLFGHYYPVCPEPELTLGSTKHSDLCYLTLLLQDCHGGLQVLHQNVWVDVPPVQGALVANMGDLMQSISNDRFKSVKHRVLATRASEGRTSVACFYNAEDKSKAYGPIKELISAPPLQRHLLHRIHNLYYYRKGCQSRLVSPIRSGLEPGPQWSSKKIWPVRLGPAQPSPN